jgi:hypothetical protein
MIAWMIGEKRMPLPEWLGDEDLSRPFYFAGSIYSDILEIARVMRSPFRSIKKGDDRSHFPPHPVVTPSLRRTNQRGVGPISCEERGQARLARSPSGVS